MKINKKNLLLILSTSFVFTPLSLLSCSSNQKPEETVPDDNSPKLDITFDYPSSKLEVGIFYTIKANTNLNTSDLKFEWSVNPSSNIQLQNDKTSELRFNAKSAGEYTFKVIVKNNEDKVLGEKSTKLKIAPNNIDPSLKWDIEFNGVTTFQYGDIELYARNIDPEWVVEKIYEERENIFLIKGAAPSDYLWWEQNIFVQDIRENSWESYIEFDLILKNSNNVNREIRSTIKFTGFKILEQVRKLAEEVDKINKTTINFVRNNMTIEEFNRISQNNLMDIISFLPNKDYEYTIENFKKNDASKTISFKFKVNYIFDGIYKISTKEFVLNCNIVQNINYSVQIEPISTNIGWWDNVELEAKLNQEPLFAEDLIYKWSCNNTNADLDPNGPSLIFFANESGKYKFSINVEDKNGNVVASNSLEMNLLEKLFEYWILIGPTNIENDLGLPQFDLDHMNETNLLKLIEQNKQHFFGSSDDELTEIDVQKNVQVKNLVKNKDVGTLVFDLILSNANNKGEQIEEKEIILNGFKKTLPNEQILNKCIDAIKIECNIPEQDRNNVLAKKLTDEDFRLLNERELYKLGAELVDPISLEYDPNNPSEIKVKTAISVGDKREIYTKIFDGFLINQGELDEVSNKILKTPNGSQSWKNKLEIISHKKTNYDNFKSKVKKMNQDKNLILKEFVYQARFLLYQSFNNSFSEVNYYTTKKSNGKYMVVAEGVAKFKKVPIIHNFAIRFWNPAKIFSTKITRGDVIKIVFDDIDLNATNFSEIDQLSWNFRTGHGGIENNSSYIKQQFGIRSENNPYTLKIFNNDTLIVPTINEQYITLFSFVIGLFKT